MQSKPKTLIAVALIFGMFGGFLLGSSMHGANAQNEVTVDEDLLEKLYDLAFHRPLDDEALDAHDDKVLDTVLDDMIASEEHQAYDGVYTAVKAYEEAKRAPGDMSSSDEDAYLDIVDSSLSHVGAWSDTLPEQELENRVIGPETARSTIQDVYDNVLNDTAKNAAEKGLFKALDSIGQPSNLPLPSDNGTSTTSTTSTAQ